MRRVRNRFFSMWDFLSLKGGIRDFNEKWARDLGLKVWSNNNGYATATKTSIKKWGHAASNSISLFPSRSIRQVLAIFCELNSKRLYQSSGEKKESCCLVFTPPQNVKLGIRELKHQTFLIHERHGGPRRTESETRFACQMQIIKQNNVKPSRTPIIQFKIPFKDLR